MFWECLAPLDPTWLQLVVPRRRSSRSATARTTRPAWRAARRSEGCSPLPAPGPGPSWPTPPARQLSSIADAQLCVRCVRLQAAVQGRPKGEIRPSLAQESRSPSVIGSSGISATRQASGSETEGMGWPGCSWFGSFSTSAKRQASDCGHVLAREARLAMNAFLSYGGFIYLAKDRRVVAVSERGACLSRTSAWMGPLVGGRDVPRLLGPQVCLVRGLAALVVWRRSQG